MKRKSKVLTGCPCCYQHILVSVCDQIKQWQWWSLLLSLAAPLQHSLPMINSSAPAEPRPAHPLGQQDKEVQQVWICSCSLLLLKHSTGEPLQIAVLWFALLCTELSRDRGTGVLCAADSGGKPLLWGECPPDAAGGDKSKGTSVLHESEPWFQIPLPVLDCGSPGTWGDIYLFPSLSAPWSQQDHSLWLSGVWAVEAPSVRIPWLEGSPPDSMGLSRAAP